MTSILVQAFIYLCAAVLMVPLAKRLGLGSVLGYLIAGLVTAPLAGWVGQETATIQHFAEFGVVMMLFLVGLELEPRMLWDMRHRLLGLGGLQMAATTAVLASIAMILGLMWSEALTVGVIFSLSSTAIVLQTFNEKGLAKTEGGRAAFSVLLLQDIAVIPVLALIPLLALPELQVAAELVNDVAQHHDELSLVAHLPAWATALVVLVTVGALIAAGHYLSRPLFRFVAESGLHEVFTAAALMLVIGIAALMSLIGLSPALGTFLAGVVLANSEFRHELEADIEPFKGLLLGLFFITVGAGIQFGVLAADWPSIVGLTLALMLVKMTILWVLSTAFHVHASNRWLFALSLAQAGEFGFVLVGFSVAQHVIPVDLAQKLSLVVALSMFLTPLLFIVFERVIQPRYQRRDDETEADEIDEQGTVIIAGIGRFGQIINRLLIANGVTTVVLDFRALQVDRLRSVNVKSYYGDASRMDLLETAGIREANALVVAIDDQARAVELVQRVKHTYPHVYILARAYDRRHLYELNHAGADHVISETYLSALQMGGDVLARLGYHPFRVEQLKRQFRSAEHAYFEELFQTWRGEGDISGFSDHYKQLFMKMDSELIHAMQIDRADQHSRSERGWTPPPKSYLKEMGG